MSKITFYICRHGKTMMNTLERVQGWCDSPLTQEGEEVAKYLGIGLKEIKFRTAYSSNLNRTKQTAQIVLKAASQSNTPIIEIEGFKEACFGEYEASDNNLLWVYISLYMQFISVDELDEALEQGKITYADIQNTVAKIDKMGLAENYTQVEERTQQALKELAENEIKKGNANILIISHAQAIAAMLLSLGGDKLMKGDLVNASVCKVSYQNGEFTVHSMGDTSYLEKGKNLT